jgi:hypothetical protein
MSKLKKRMKKLEIQVSKAMSLFYGDACDDSSPPVVVPAPSQEQQPRPQLQHIEVDFLRYFQ